MQNDVVSLVKGGHKKSSPAGNLAIGALLVNRQPTIEPPCIVGEFADDCQLQRVVFRDTKHCLAELAVTRHPLGYLCQLPDACSDIQLLFSCSPATVVTGRLLAGVQRHTLVVAVADLVDTVWHDGVLAHVDRGQILSLVASVGKARLTVPCFWATDWGLDPCDLPQLDRGDHARACLVATFARLWSFSPPMLYLDRFDLCSAVCLAVASSLDIDGIKVIVEQKNLTGQWRRLLQNIGAQLHTSGDGWTVSQLAKFVVDSRLIAETINRQGAVIPLTLFTSC